MSPLQVCAPRGFQSFEAVADVGFSTAPFVHGHSSALCLTEGLISSYAHRAQGWDELVASDVARATARDDPGGLTSAQAAKLFAVHGANELSAREGSSWLPILVRQFKSPFIYVLLGAALLSFYLGEELEALVIFLILGANAAIGFVQEHRAERTLQALAKLTESTCRVRRDGSLLTLPSREVVPGELLDLSAGDRVPGDATLLDSVGLQCDESMLTGESMPADKQAGRPAYGTADVDESDSLWAGTIIVAGRGRARVTATGMQTRLGRLVRASRAAGEELPLLRDLNRLSRTLIALVIGFLALLLAAALYTGAPIGGVLLTVISMAVAAIPEGLPIALVVGLSIGAWRLAKLNVLVRRVPAVEGLGAVTFICTDKTGTLTGGQMKVARAFIGGREYEGSSLASRDPRFAA
ncbi:MAG TPA: HAD-IC family P-type ATPase, partial [Thermoplasmata archaeon]|nr:HAD-IC family P-type ATPase [Thermoplasmata archaeon]